MTEVQVEVCNLIANVLFASPLHINNQIDWNDVYEEMCQQSVRGLISKVLFKLPLSDGLKEKWEKDILRIILQYSKVGYEQTLIGQLFDNEHVPYIILKGAAAAIYYPQPLLRATGDIDLFVPKSYHSQAAALMRKNGYIENPHDVENHRHRVFFRNNICFELHKTYATINGKEEMQYVDDLLDLCCRSESKNGYEIGWVRYTDKVMDIKLPSVYVNGIILLEHIAHHLMGGLGLKQVIDWIVYVNAVLDDEHWESFRIMAQEAGLEKLAKTVTRAGQIYLGLPDDITWCKEADAKVCQAFIEYLFKNGNFGAKMKSIGKVAKVRHKSAGFKGFFLNLQKAGEHNWKAYKKHQSLRPVAWIYQICRYTRQVVATPNAFKNILVGSSEARKRELLMMNMGVHVLTIEEKAGSNKKHKQKNLSKNSF